MITEDRKVFDILLSSLHYNYSTCRRRCLKAHRDENDLFVWIFFS